MAVNKPTKRLHTESSDSENETKNNKMNNTSTLTFPRYIILESMEETPLAKLSPFVIQKVISGNFTPKNVKSLRNGNLLIEVEKKKHADFLLQMKVFHNMKIKSYPHEKLNSSKGVVRSRELPLCTLEEVKTELKSQGVIDARRISIRREGKVIETNTYILTFGTPTIPKEIKIGYNIERVEQFVPNPLRCYKCQKFGHHEDQCRGMPVCGRCGQKSPDHEANTCERTCQCANCEGDHPAYAKICEHWKREKEIMTVKHTRNISFPEAKKVVAGYMQGKSYSQVAKPTIPNTDSQYEKLVRQLLELGPSDWPKFIEEIRKTLPKTNVTPNISPNPKVNQNLEKGTEAGLQTKKIPHPKASTSLEEENKKTKDKKDTNKTTKNTSPKKQTQQKKTPQVDTNKIKITNRFSELEEMETESPPPITQAQNPPPIIEAQSLPMIETQTPPPMIEAENAPPIIETTDPPPPLPPPSRSGKISTKYK